MHGMRATGARGMMGDRGLRGQLFKGITLSDAEKTNIKAVQTKYASQMKALREQFKPQMQAARDARQRGDSAALKELRQKSTAQREQSKQLMLAQRNDLRAALTPANQVTFDANVAALEKKAADHAQNAGKQGRRRPPVSALR
jgi:protein CpxP